MFEFVQLRSFIAVARELHFGRAAQRLNMTQPPLSRHIQMLERELGVQLLVRTSRSVRLTPAGQVFFNEAKRILQQSEAAVQSAREAASTDRGSLSVGFIGVATYGYLPKLVTALAKELPNVDVTFREMTSAEQLEALAYGRIDLGLVRPLTPEPDLRAACVMREPLALAIPLDHPLSLRRQPELADLDGEPFIYVFPRRALPARDAD